MEANEYLFVYGTLRDGFDNEARRLLLKHADFIREGTFRGKLFLVNDYPGAVNSEDDRDIVHGEVYRLNNSRPLLAGLNEYEGCSGSYPQPTEYTREEAMIRLAGKAAVRAWVYIYNRHTKGLYEIVSGDFMMIL